MLIPVKKYKEERGPGGAWRAFYEHVKQVLGFADLEAMIHRIEQFKIDHAEEVDQNAQWWNNVGIFGEENKDLDREKET